MSSDVFKDLYSIVPTEQIAEAKRRFPQARIDYEILVRIDDPWAGLAECSSAFARAGLRCQSLRYGEKGLAFFRLQDRGESDLGALARAAATAERFSIVSWSTVIGVSEAA